MSENQLVPFSEVTKFHGHACPGSALGYRVAEVAMNKFNATKAEDEELIVIVENDSCAVDAIQVVTGCTFGKGNLIFKDYGKHVYTFFNRNTGENIRIYAKANFNELVPEFFIVKDKISKGLASDEDKKDFENHKKELIEKVLSVPSDDLFVISDAEIELPEEARLYNSVECAECGELVSEHRVKEKDGKVICIPCFNK